MTTILPSEDTTTNNESALGAEKRNSLTILDLEDPKQSQNAESQAAAPAARNMNESYHSLSEQFFKEAAQSLRQSEDQDALSLAKENEDVVNFLTSLKDYEKIGSSVPTKANTLGSELPEQLQVVLNASGFESTSGLDLKGSSQTGTRAPVFGGGGPRFSMASRRSGEHVTFPADFYSFLACYGPIENPFFFFFGLMIFLFQITFSLFAMLSEVHPEWNTHGKVDNPSDGLVGSFMPSNVCFLVRATQVLAVLSYCVFADASVKDVITAIEIWPNREKVSRRDKYGCMVFSCVLRALQGIMAILATFILIMSTTEVMIIILDFLAMNFVSNISKLAFELALWGKYGPSLEKEARKISNRPIPYCMVRKNNHRRFYLTVCLVCGTLISLLLFIIVAQDRASVWSTQIVRVQINGDDSIGAYSGCYKVAPYKMGGFSNRKRKVYESYDENKQNGARLGYCFADRVWYLFDSGETTEACELGDDEIVAQSSSTLSFDISTMYDEPWYSMSGSPLDIYFFESMDEETIAETCNSFLFDGHCDNVFNSFEYRWDRGDCCAPTCSHPHCGTGDLREAFGESIDYGDGFPNCKDPNMVPMTIRIDKVLDSRSNRTEEVPDPETRQASQEVDFTEPLLSVDCDNANVISVPIAPSMEGKSETLMVDDGANCTIRINNTTSTKKPILYVDYTVFHGDQTTPADAGDDDHQQIVILEETSSNSVFAHFERIPECYFEKLSNHTHAPTIYTEATPENMAIKWFRMTSKMSKFSTCEDEFFLERYAMSVFNMAAPMVRTIGNGTTLDSVVVDESTSVVLKSFDGEDFDSSHSLHIEKSLNDFGIDRHSLWINSARQCIWRNVECNGRSVEGLYLNGLGLDGTIPSHIGLLTNLANLDIANNHLRGTIPTAFGYMTSLRTLNLDQNLLSGTIPSEIGMLTNLEFLDLYNNSLTGSIPKPIQKLATRHKLKMIHIGGNTDINTEDLPDAMKEIVYADCPLLCNDAIGENDTFPVLLRSCEKLLSKLESQEDSLSINECSYLNEKCFPC